MNVGDSRYIIVNSFKNINTAPKDNKVYKEENKTKENIEKE